MKQVQEALKDIGIPVMAGIWRATSPNQNPPVQYVVYSTTTTGANIIVGGSFSTTRAVDWIAIGT